MKEKILQNCQRVGAQQLLQFVANGTVTLEELNDAGLQPEKAKYIQDNLAALENALYQKAVELNSIKACDEYLKTYPFGLHAEDVRNIKMAIEDGPWVQTLQMNTREGYETYAHEYPGKHTAEIAAKLEELKEDELWTGSCTKDTTESYQLYLSRYPQGKYAAEAQRRIEQVSYREQAAGVLNTLKGNANAFSAQQIQDFVNNGAISWDDLSAIFGSDKMAAIRSFVQPAELPDSLPPDELQKNTTEVYFWGTPSSGKTCALGALISRMDSKGILEKLTCGGYNYMVRLSNIFGQENICTFPDSTSIGSIQEMMISLKDEKDKFHRLTLIDLAGELFRSVYFKRHNLVLDEAKEDTLNKTISYLKDNRNKKIHFFVVEYGAHDRQWEGLTMKDYLDDMVGFLKEHEIFRKSTVGVYVLVTKCDMIPCSRDDRPKSAYDYICEKMPSFWNVLQDTCKRAGVKDLSVLSYSVGDVFAQKLCHFDPHDTEKVINRLISKTEAEGGMFDWLKG